MRMSRFWEHCTISSQFPQLIVVRNDVYARFSHVAYNKGTALGELMRRDGLTASEVFAAGDHLNDLPMLNSAYARWLAAPGNAISAVREAVTRQRGFVSRFTHGEGVAEGLARLLGRPAISNNFYCWARQIHDRLWPFSAAPSAC
jgi:hypothetical protein